MMNKNPKDEKPKPKLKFIVRIAIAVLAIVMIVVMAYENGFLLHLLRPVSRGYDKLTLKFVDNSMDFISIFIFAQSLDLLCVALLAGISETKMFNLAIGVCFGGFIAKNIFFLITLWNDFNTSNTVNHPDNMANDLRYNCIFMGLDCIGDIPTSEEALRPDPIFWWVVIVTGVKIILMLIGLALAVLALEEQLIESAMKTADLYKFLNETRFTSIDISHETINNTVKNKTKQKYENQNPILNNNMYTAGLDNYQ